MLSTPDAVGRGLGTGQISQEFMGFLRVRATKPCMRDGHSGLVSFQLSVLSGLSLLG